MKCDKPVTELLRSKLKTNACGVHNKKTSMHALTKREEKIKLTVFCCS